MATPSRAPRRTAASMNIDLASGTPAPGANSYQAARKTASVADGGTYDKQRSAGKSGLTPQSVPDTKVSK